MKRPMVTLQTRLRFSQVLPLVLEFHLFKGAEIIDPTPGEKYSWEEYERRKGKGFFPPMNFNIHFIPDDIDNFNFTADYVKRNGPTDAIFFDPPYIFHSKKKGQDVRKDDRGDDYGGYHHDLSDVKRFMMNANEHFPDFLKEEGLLFLKYTDVFSLEERHFYFCAALWSNLFFNFHVIDHYIIRHHHISPTAWQVKNRPCGIVNYTYLTIFKKGSSV
jgi:hypothetical protein